VLTEALDLQQYLLSEMRKINRQGAVIYYLCQTVVIIEINKIIPVRGHRNIFNHILQISNKPYNDSLFLNVDSK
jgi:hypothetical protein